MFDTVINVPADQNIGDLGSVGGDGLTTQVNISNGDTVGFNFVANSGSEVNIGGGNISPLGFNIIGGDFNLIDWLQFRCWWCFAR